MAHYVFSDAECAPATALQIGSAAYDAPVDAGGRYDDGLQSEELDLAATVDISKLSYSELVALSRSLDEQIRGKRDEELKSLPTASRRSWWPQASQSKRD